MKDTDKKWLKFTAAWIAYGGLIYGCSKLFRPAVGLSILAGIGACFFCAWLLLLIWGERKP